MNLINFIEVYNGYQVYQVYKILVPFKMTKLRELNLNIIIQNQRKSNLLYNTLVKMDNIHDLIVRVFWLYRMILIIMEAPNVKLK